MSGQPNQGMGQPGYQQPGMQAPGMMNNGMYGPQWGQPSTAISATAPGLPTTAPGGDPGMGIQPPPTGDFFNDPRRPTPANQRANRQGLLAQNNYNVYG